MVTLVMRLPNSIEFNPLFVKPSITRSRHLSENILYCIILNVKGQKSLIKQKIAKSFIIMLSLTCLSSKKTNPFHE